LGEFTVIVEAAGYESAQKEEVSVRVTGRTQVDVYLRRLSAGGRTGGVPRRALLAPKAKEALEKGSQALSADKTGEAEKYVGEAMPLAPGHPDVLYVQGVLSLKQHNCAQGQDALEKATQIDPSHARAFAGWEWRGDRAARRVAAIGRSRLVGDALEDRAASGAIADGRGAL